MGRSGGYQLGSWISHELKSKFIHEPITNKLNENGDKVVTKYLITELEDYNLDSIKQYNKVIGLIREGDRDCAESQCWAERNKIWRNNYSISQQWIQENETYISEMEKWVRSKREKLLNIEKLDFIVSYEGIYQRKDDIPKLLEYLVITSPKYLHFLDKSLRLRDVGVKQKKRLI